MQQSEAKHWHSRLTQDRAACEGLRLSIDKLMREHGDDLPAGTLVALRSASNARRALDQALARLHEHIGVIADPTTKRQVPVPPGMEEAAPNPLGAVERDS